MASKKGNKRPTVEKPSTWEAFTAGITPGLKGVGVGVSAITLGPLLLPLGATALAAKATDRLYWVGKGKDARPIVRLACQYKFILMPHQFTWIFVPQ